MLANISDDERARQIVTAFYDDGARGDITSFAPYLAKDFELFVPSYLPPGGNFDKSRYLELLPRVAATLDYTRLRYISLTVECRHVVALIEIGVRGTAGTIVVSEHWDIEHDQAIRLRVAYFDPKLLLDQLAPYQSRGLEA